MEGGEGGQRKGGGTATVRGRGQEGRGKNGANTLARGGSCRKKARTEKSDTETEAGGES